MSASILKVENIAKTYGSSLRAVDGVSFDIKERETLALVGESGCGKSTVARLVLGLTKLTAGRIEFDQANISQLSQRQLRSVRRELQFVFQDPYSSLDPRMTAGSIVTEPMVVHGMISGPKQRQTIAGQLLEAVGLSARHIGQRPRQFSGGQRQRLGIIRAFALSPKLIVADEPVSALDVSIRSQVLNILQDLQEEKGTAYLFISHDMPTVRHIADRVAVMYLGKIMEIAPKAKFFQEPHHPYSQALLSAVPAAHPARRKKRILLPGDPPSPAAVPAGCRFHPRCPMAKDICKTTEPPLQSVGDGHSAACHFAGPWPIKFKELAGAMLND
ncbi:ABC transporter ATP-binding protein [Rhizobium mayense]|uniref:ABC transporter ATP-binding protein n=1 Tax=Rhizobium mayense TaxID=1312184 RepID=A0ABT7K075_9HYPH|nr:ABC transporter ATP-binding protein [Rhizobium mayense]MDL2402009.1 ABC transporter ATP-binding protein [Rhizobium mayense]